MVTLCPLVKVNQPSLRTVHLGLPLSTIVIRLQDLLTPSGDSFNKTFHEIKSAGEIHAHQNFNQNIILSTVMKDNLIAKVPLKMYVEAIKILKPDSCFTPDAETYESTTYKKNNVLFYDGQKVATEEVKRISAATIFLKQMFPYQHFIGLVKGSTKEVVKSHAKFLVSQGIDDLAFHTGDFMRFGINDNIQRAKLYATAIKGIGKRLYLYGMGCQSRLLEFSFADAYITYNHFITARHGIKYHGTKQLPSKKGYSVNLVRNNLIELIKNVDNMKSQKNIMEVESEWGKVSVMTDLLMHPVQDMAVAMQL